MRCTCSCSPHQVEQYRRHRLLRVARTLADLEGAAEIRAPHMAEAVQYRALDRSLVRD